VLVELAGESIDAARARVEACHRQHLRALSLDVAEVAQQERREQAKRDREEAEYQLGVRVPARDCAVRGGRGLP
jgi:hypothetical protein